jgi:predicted Zn-dependent peptidase
MEVLKMIKKSYERFNEEVYIIKLRNGMQVHILPKDDPYFTTYVELSIPYGALDLNFKVGDENIQSPYGTAHFLEHKIFAMPDGDAFVKFSTLGVEANAMTSYNQTSYLFSATENVMDALSHLMDMMDTPFFNHDNVEQEKNIIAEELKMYLDDPNTVMQNKLMENMYHVHPIRYDIGGTISSIRDVTPEILNQVYEHFYNPSNRLITIAGKVNLSSIKKFFKIYDARYPDKHRKPKTLFPKEPNRLVVKHEVEDTDNGIDKLMIGIKLQPKVLSKSAQIKKEMAMSMMLNMLLGSSSKMYTLLLEEKLINQSFYIQASFERKAENIIIFAESKKVYKLKKRLIDFLINDAKDELSEKSFERYRKVYLGQFVYALNNLETKAYLYGKYFHLGSSLFEVVDILTELNYQDVLEALTFIEKKYVTTLIHKKA